MEAHLIREQMLLPKDLKSDWIRQILNDFATPVDEICMSQAAKNRLFVKQDRRVQTHRMKQKMTNRFGLMHLDEEVQRVRKATWARKRVAIPIPD